MEINFSRYLYVVKCLLYLVSAVPDVVEEVVFHGGEVGIGQSCAIALNARSFLWQGLQGAALALGEKLRGHEDKCWTKCSVV